MPVKGNKAPVVAAKPTQAQAQAQAQLHPSMAPASRNAKGQYMARPVVAAPVHRTKAAHKTAAKSHAE